MSMEPTSGAQAADDVLKRRFAGAVFADEDDNLPSPNRKARVLQHPDAGIGLAHSLEADQRRLGGVRHDRLTLSRGSVRA